MKRSRKNRLIYWTVGIIILIIAANGLVRFKINRSYSELLNNYNLVSSFYAAKDEVLPQLASAEKLDYQKIAEGKVVYATSSWLPAPGLIKFDQKNTPGVLLPDVQSSLKSHQPYRLLVNKGIYIAAPICTTDCQKTMYIVYSKVLP